MQKDHQYYINKMQFYLYYVKLHMVHNSLAASSLLCTYFFYLQFQYVYHCYIFCTNNNSITVYWNSKNSSQAASTYTYRQKSDFLTHVLPFFHRPLANRIMIFRSSTLLRYVICGHRLFRNYCWNIVDTATIWFIINR